MDVCTVSTLSSGLCQMLLPQASLCGTIPSKMRLLHHSLAPYKALFSFMTLSTSYYDFFFSVSPARMSAAEGLTFFWFPTLCFVPRSVSGT